MKKINAFMLAISILFLLTLTLEFTSAELFQFDNVKSYDAVKQEVTIVNTFGLGGDIAKFKLDTPTINYVPAGYVEIARFTLDSFNDNYNNPLEKIDTYNTYDLNTKIDRKLDYKLLTYEQVWIEEVNKTPAHFETKEKWVDFDYSKLIKGTYTIGIFTTTYRGDNIEWIPTFYGVKISEWAVWIVEGHGKSLSSSGGSRTVKAGTGILIGSGDIQIRAIKKLSTCTPTTGQILYANGTIISNASFSGDWANFSAPYPTLNKTYEYEVIGWSAGASYNAYYLTVSGNFPVVETDFTWANGNGLNTGGWYDAGDNDNVWCIIALEYSLTDSAQNVSLTLNSPINYYNTSTPSVTFNWTALDYNIGGGIKNVSLSIDGNVEYTNTTGINGTYTYTKVLTSGLHNWSVLAWNNNATYNQSETRFINLTILSPTINLYTPDGVNNYNITFVRFNASVTDNLKVQNVTLYIDTILNETNTSNYNGTYIFDRYLSEGTHTWYILAYDNESNPSQSSTINFKVDLTSPIITFTYPLNQTYYTPWANTSALNVTFNWSSYDANLNYCWYSKNNGANTTLTCNTNLTTNTTYGSSVNILACANDSVYNTACSSRTATYKYNVFEINQTFNNPVLESTPQDYYANIYLDSSLNINNVYFTYNGTNYSASYSEIGNYTRLEKTSFYVPNVNSDSNSSVTWWVLLDDSSRINLSTRLQQVNNLVYSSVCNATYPYYIFNFTLKDERTQLNINGTIETDVRIKTANGTTTLFNWTSSLYNTSSYLCSNLPISSGNSYIVDGTIKYYASNENYSAMVEYYNLLNFDYNNNTYYQNISLYDINVTEGTEFQLTFKDSSYRARENILIYIYRQYLPEGIFKVVELPKTDSNGQTIVHLVRNDVVYNLVAVDSSGNVLGTLNNVLAFCEDYTIGDCKINFQGTTSETDLENYLDSLGLSYTLSFDDTTNIISFVFSSTTNDNKDVRLEVISSALVTNRTICNTSLNAISGTLTCDVSSIVNSSSNVNVKIYLSNQEVINENLALDTSNWNVPGVIFFGFLFILIIGIMFIESKEGMIIGIILGLIVLVSLGVVKGKIIGFTSGILWLIIVGVIILIKLNKENKQ